MWNRQSHEDRHLIILDDGGTYDTQKGDDWELISVPERYSSLGEKFHALATKASLAGDAIALFEDDDVYLPDYLKNHVSALSDHGISVPEVVYSDDHFIGTLPHKRPACDHERRMAMHHGSWAYSSDLYVESGGYPSDVFDFDIRFWSRLAATGASIGDPLEFGPIQYIYRWQTSGYCNGSGYGHAMHDSVEKSHPQVRHDGVVLPEMDDLTKKYYRLMVSGHIADSTHQAH